MNNKKILFIHPSLRLVYNWQRQEIFIYICDIIYVDSLQSTLCMSDEMLISERWARFLISFFCKTEAQISRNINIKFRQRYIYTWKEYSIHISRNFAIKFRQRSIYTWKKYSVQISRNFTIKFRQMDLDTVWPILSILSRKICERHFNYFIF